MRHNSFAGGTMGILEGLEGDTSAIPEVTYERLVAANVHYGAFDELVQGPPPPFVKGSPLPRGCCLNLRTYLISLIAAKLNAP